MSAIRRLCPDTIAEFWEEVTHLQDGFPGGDEVVAADYFEKSDVHVKAHEIASAGGTALAYKEHAFSGALMCQNPEAHHIFQRNSHTAKPLDQRKWQSSTCLIPTFCIIRRACGEHLDLLGKKMVSLDRVVEPWPSKSLTAKQKRDGDAWNAKFIKLLLRWGLLEPEVFVAVGAVANEFPEQPCFEGLGFQHVHHALHPSPNSFAPELFKLLSLSHVFCAAVDIIRNKGEASFDAQAYTAYFKKVNEQAGTVVSSDLYHKMVDQIVEADVDLHVRGAWREMVEKCPVFREQLSTWQEPFADPYNFSERSRCRAHRRWDPLDLNQRREEMAPVLAASRAAKLGVPINLLPPPTQQTRPLGGGTLHEQRCSVCFTAGHRAVTCPTLGKKRKPRSVAQDRAAEKRKQKRKAAAMQRKRGPASPPRKEALPQGPVHTPPPHHLGGEGLTQGPVLTPPNHLGGEGDLVENLAACGYPREQARVALARCSGSPCVRLNAALDLLLER